MVGPLMEQPQYSMLHRTRVEKYWPITSFLTLAQHLMVHLYSGSTASCTRTSVWAPQSGLLSRAVCSLVSSYQA